MVRPLPFKPIVALAVLLLSCSSESPRAPSSSESAGPSRGSDAIASASGEDADGIPRRPLAGPKRGTAVWVLKDPATKPSDSDTVAMVFDEDLKAPVLYHGDDAAFYAWDGNDWTKHPWPEGEPNPGPRRAPIAYDSERHRIVLQGGYDLNNTTGCQRCSDIWEWFDGRWTKRSDVNSPGLGRNGHQLVYDAFRKVTVLTGGYFGAGLLDSATWEYDGTEWREVVPPESGYMPARWYHATVFDPDHRKVVLFAGANDTRAATYMDTWGYDGDSWVKTSFGTSVLERHSHAMVYDSVRKVVVAYGGSYYVHQVEYDGSDWEIAQLASPNPGARHRHAMAFDPIRRRFVLFGGRNNETWEGYVRGNSCVTDDDCHTGHCVDGVCCQTACGGGNPNDCVACSVAAGGSADGVCTPLADGTSCDDGNVCTEGDSCQAGECTATPISGVPCDDGNVCTEGDTCEAGSCVGTPITCPESGACDEYFACDPVKGCLYAPKPAGTVCRAASCEDGQATAEARCDGTSVTCPAPVVTSCELYVCGANACLDSCDSDEDCAQGAVCRDGACVILDEPDAGDGSDAGDEPGTDAGDEPGTDAGDEPGTDAGTGDEAGTDADSGSGSLDTPEAESDDTGCSCRTAGGHGDGHHAAWVGIGMAVAMFARRRREAA